MKTVVGTWILVVALGVFSGCGGDSSSSNAAGGTGNDGGSGAAGSSGTSGTGGTSGSGGTAGDSGISGTGGTGAGPQVTSSKLDLLLVVDNSRSMADKQAVLNASATTLVSRLTNPRCVDAQGIPTATQPANADEACPTGNSREMAPVRDMHVGVISSSLGGHGADTCSGIQGNPTEDDRGELVARGAATTYQNRGYLVWDPNQTANPPGERDATSLTTNVTELVSGVGEVGCGFEATLESWYRFLIDPAPPQSVIRQNNQAIVQRPNQTVLTQRAQFLRPDSAVLIVILSDENDCSIFDGGIAWLAGQGGSIDGSGGLFSLPRATSTCATDPNSPCCRSCNTVEPSGPPAGCTATGSDPGCQQPMHDAASDPINLRCFDQKRRFGVDFMYGIGRYVEGLTSRTIHDYSGTVVPNPLFSDLTGGGAPPRDPSLISVMGIVGVPWQDLAKDPADADSLRYMTAAELDANGRWPVIMGDPALGTPPLDPFMRESVSPRTGTNPITNDAIQPPSATTPLANPINGHEHENPRRNDLQYSCIFPLTTPRDCGVTAGCDCSTADGMGNKVLCQSPSGSYSTRQYYAKAYPGIRHLDLLSRLGSSSVVASICPRNVDRPNRDDYAYNPAVQAMIDRMKNVIE